ncbi:MAG: hypothetical protein C5B58_13045 [Acidobacteria bacterium]|nr:MAG: hypothetical protein C5B58_13045 [Acidobacteriota bacterium]
MSSIAQIACRKIAVVRNELRSLTCGRYSRCSGFDPSSPTVTKGSPGIGDDFLSENSFHAGLRCEVLNQNGTKPRKTPPDFRQAQPNPSS